MTRKVKDIECLVCAVKCCDIYRRDVECHGVVMMV